MESEPDEEEEEEFSLSYRRPVAPPISGLPGIQAWTCARSVIEFGRCFGQADDVLTTLIEKKRAAFVERFPTPESVCADADLLELLFQGVLHAYADGVEVAELCKSHHNVQASALPAEKRGQIEEARRKLKVMRNAAIRARAHLIQRMYPAPPSPDLAPERSVRADSPDPSAPAPADAPSSPTPSASSLTATSSASSPTASSAPIASASAAVSASTTATATEPVTFRVTGTAEQRALFHKFVQSAAKRAKVSLCKD